MPGDWRTVGLLVGLFVLVIVLVKPLGWAITGALLFAGAATILGQSPLHPEPRDRRGAVGGELLRVLLGLGIPLPAGILDGIL